MQLPKSKVNTVQCLGNEQSHHHFMPPFPLLLGVFDPVFSTAGIHLRSFRLCCKIRITSHDRSGLNNKSDSINVAELSEGTVLDDQPPTMAASAGQHEQPGEPSRATSAEGETLEPPELTVGCLDRVPTQRRQSSNSSRKYASKHATLRN